MNLVALRLKAASNGQVKITMTCKNDKKVLIDESLLSDKELLEDLILVALKDVQAKLSPPLAKNVWLVPPGMNLPF